MLEKKFLISSLCLVVVLGLSATAAMGADILFVSSMDPNHMPGNDALKSFLEGLGHTVTYFDDDEDEATTEAAAAAADVVFISESVGSSQIETEITEIETPMIIGEPWAWDEMGLTDGGGAGTDVASTDIMIVDPGHYLAAELSGTVTVLTDITSADGTARFGNGVAGSEARVIATATLSDGQTYDVIFVYEKGAALAVPPADGSPQVAADMRICFGFDYISQALFNENAYILLGMAVNYALGVIIPQARDPEPRDGALYKDTWVGLSWTPGDFAASHDVYLGENFGDVNDGTGGTFRGNQPKAYFVAGLFGFAYPDGLAPGVTYYWRIDEVNDLDPNSPWKGNVWSFMIPPNTAYDPDPPDGGKSVDPNVTLSWTAGLDAKLHHVYFGDNLADVNAGTGETSKGPAVVTAYTPTPGPLALETTYYWRVDELDGITTHKGDVWSFTTVGFSLVVDDFESYNDLDPGDPNSNRIFNAWLDGYDIPTNGSLVGYEVPPFCERTIVRSGKQAMPLSYSNTAGATYSEAALSLSPPQDWTKSGVQSLVLYFYGDAGNTGGQLYVKINNAKVLFDANPAAISRPFWTQWNIDLATVGTNLAGVNTLSIGVDGAGVQGTLYVDDIRLYRQAPEVLAPQDPGTDNLVAYYAMENNTQDGSGNGHHGTPIGAPVYAPGIAGMALDFDGVDDRLDLGSVDVAGSGITLSLWLKPESYMYDDTRVISKTTSTSANDHWWMLSTNGNNHVLRFRLKTNDGGNTTTLIANSGDVLEGEWTHAAATWDGSMMRIYRNLQEVGSTAKGGTAVAVDASVSAAIGNQPPDAGDKHWVGLIDEVRIHNRGLSEAELLYVASSQ